ncbi:MAG TPA: hypothetical protein VEC57_06220 [Candidatus Limnocylindrales bacterium]|nr:hypothetical protein [Candidatus Limnocylindrales bacterium]
MRARELVSSSTTGDGRAVTLHREAGGYIVRVANEPLMGSRAHGSEQIMAERSLAALRATRPRVLVAGLGMGYTLRAALDVLPRQAEVVVVELLPCIVEWNRGVLAPLAARPLEDHRVRLEQMDLVDYLHGVEVRFDAILLDVDNGPEAFTVAGNSRLYEPAGLRMLRAALAPGGVLAVWSAFDSPRFEKALARAGFAAETVALRARGDKGGRHTVFLGRAA